MKINWDIGHGEHEEKQCCLVAGMDTDTRSWFTVEHSKKEYETKMRFIQSKSVPASIQNEECQRWSGAIYTEHKTPLLASATTTR